MPYEMHRLFCATPFELEEERIAFYAAVSEFNENVAMKRDILFVPISLVPLMADKRAYQGAVESNIRACRYYIQVLEDSWGPPQRDFERDYALARKLASDANSTVKEAVLLFKKPLLPDRVQPGISELRSASGAVEFETIEYFKGCLRDLFVKWLESIGDDAVRAQAAS